MRPQSEIAGSSSDQATLVGDASADAVGSGSGRPDSSIHGIEHSSVDALSTKLAPYAVPDWSKRIPALDGLRGVAIFLVLLAHSVFIMKAKSPILSSILALGRLSWSGVDLFFVLSGFLIGGILLDAKHSSHYFKTFYIRRAFRIWPPYCLLVAFFFVRHPLPLPAPWFSYLTLTQNFWFHGLSDSMAVTWSLCVEEQFYLVIPFLIRNFNRRQLVTVLVAVTVAAPVLRVLLHVYYPFENDHFCYVLAPCRADALCLGVLSAVLVRSPAAWRLLLIKRRWLNGALAVAFAGMALMTWKFYREAPIRTFGLSCIALFYTFILLAAISADKGIFHRVICNWRLRGLGTVAYGAYLAHSPLLVRGRRISLMVFESWPMASSFLGGMLGIAATLSLAALSWKFFEKPLLKRGHAYQY